MFSEYLKLLVCFKMKFVSIEMHVAFTLLTNVNSAGRLVLREPVRGPINTMTRQSFQRNLSIREKTLISMSSSGERQIIGFRDNPNPSSNVSRSNLHSGLTVLSEEALAAALSGDVTLSLPTNMGSSASDVSHNRLINFPSYLCRVKMHPGASQKPLEQNKIIGRLVVESKMEIQEQSLTLMDWEITSEKVQNMPDIPIFSYQSPSVLKTPGSLSRVHKPMLTSPVQVYRTDNKTSKVEGLFHWLQNTDKGGLEGKNSGATNPARKTSTSANPALIAVMWGQNARLAESTEINTRVLVNMVNEQGHIPAGDTESTVGDKSELVRSERCEMSETESEEGLVTVPDHALKSEDKACGYRCGIDFQSGAEDESRNETESEVETVISESDQIFTLENCTIEQFLKDEISCTRRSWDKCSLKKFIKDENTCAISINPDSRTSVKNHPSNNQDIRPLSSPEQLDELLNFINSEVAAIRSLLPK